MLHTFEAAGGNIDFGPAAARKANRQGTGSSQPAEATRMSFASFAAEPSVMVRDELE